MNQRPLTGEERYELAVLNTKIAATVLARRNWLDAKMVETSDLQVGDDLYDLESGYKVGVVTAIKRFHRGDFEFDSSPSCYYEYSTGGMGRDNTSRQIGKSFGTREDALQRAEWRAERLRGSL